ncbi:MULTISPECIES: hypothetical protein [unclassified Mycoplasma]|uniref:hypothetical protein n=1 Tax=unclassified Mycoplasma TaxID=2683645 RepID=UPI000FDD2D8C
MPKQKTETSYLWWKDQKIFGTCLLIVAVSFQIFAFLDIPVMTTIHGYTVGLMLGFYNPLFYALVIYVALRYLTSGRLVLPRWIKIKTSTYCVLVVSILFVSASSGYYQTETGWFAVGPKTWTAFERWFLDFTRNWNAWFPANTNGGVIGVFLYSFFAMILSGVGAFVVAILWVVVPFSILFTGSVWGLYYRLLSNRVVLKVKPIKRKKVAKSSVATIAATQGDSVSSEQVVKGEKVALDLVVDKPNLPTSDLTQEETTFDDPF